MLQKLFSKLGNFIGFQSKETKAVQINTSGDDKIDRKRLARRRHCLRNESLFGAPWGTKSHRRFYYKYNPAWFATTKFRDAGGQSTALRTDDQPHSL